MSEFFRKFTKKVFLCWIFMRHNRVFCLRSVKTLLYYTKRKALQCFSPRNLDQKKLLFKINKAFSQKNISMKHHELIFSIVKIPLDFIVIWGSFFIAREIRQMSDLIPGVYLPVQTIDSSSLHAFALIGGCIFILLFASHKLYSLQISHSKIQEILDVIRYALYWFVFFSVGVYFGKGIIYDGAELPRLIILFSMIFGIIGAITIRILLNSIQAYLLQHKKISQRNLLLISNKSQNSLHNILSDIEASKIYHILWYANIQEQKHMWLTYIWGFQEIQKLLADHICDEILYIDSDFKKEDLYKIWELSRIYGVRYRYITNNFDITKTNSSLSLINQTPVIEIQNTPLEHWGRVWKRTFDMAVSLAVLIIFSPLYVVIALLIYREDPSGPVIYKNRRIGQYGKVFNCYKFRYLKWEYCIKESYGTQNELDPAIEYEKELIAKQSSRSGPLYKIQKDPRKTNIGSFLEKYSLDELPQFFNVIRGDMSIIGPRPHQPREVELYELYQQRLLTVKPGITGMAQVNGREQNDFSQEAELDIFYIENWSFLLDLKIMFKTCAIIFSRK